MEVDARVGCVHRLDEMVHRAAQRLVIDGREPNLHGATSKGERVIAEVALAVVKRRGERVGLAT